VCVCVCACVRVYVTVTGIWCGYEEQMAAPCLGVVGTFQYEPPQCPTEAAEEDPQARCEDKGGTPDELVDICPKCNDEVVWVRRRIDVGPSHLQCRAASVP